MCTARWVSTLPVSQEVANMLPPCHQYFVYEVHKIFQYVLPLLMNSKMAVFETYLRRISLSKFRGLVTACDVGR
jgi:hypothetical protein